MVIGSAAQFTKFSGEKLKAYYTNYGPADAEDIDIINLLISKKPAQVMRWSLYNMKPVNDNDTLK